MNDFYIREISPENAESVIKDIGFDKSYIKTALKKYDFKLYKICCLSCQQATIIKQLALSVGADAAIHREVITCKIEKTDLLLGSTISQLEIICQKMKKQPFSLQKISEQLLEQLNQSPSPIIIRRKEFNRAKKTYIMGILNITPDSFSDGGIYLAPDKAAKHAEEMIECGVDIIDIGGESTRAYSKEVNPQEEMARVIPVIQKIRSVNSQIVLSIDTRHSETAEEAVKYGVDIINDVSGLEWDDKMPEVAAKFNVPVIITHSLSSPETMQINPVYEENIVDCVYKELFRKTQTAINAGISPKNIIIDPGIGFGKTFEHNIELIKRIDEFKSMKYPVLVGVSRKSVISKVIDGSAEEREDANIALNSYLIIKGVNIIRVHDVKKHFSAVKMLDKLL
ncbi:MAG TPA: dihydropteroate synthase [Candidatus Gastranaerophilales bacterium]|nr:dihydropteroate synthase [Candidatus Gastranaerophilales bacterium]